MNKFWTIILILALIFIESQILSFYNTEDEILIEEATVNNELIDSLKDCLIFIENSGNGIVLTSDGVVLTLSSIINTNSEFIIKEQSLIYEVLKRDRINDLALVQLGKQGIETNCQYSLDDIIQGQDIYILGIDEDKQYVFNKGIVKNISDLIHTNIIEDESLSGSIAFNEEGKIIGMVKINNNGFVDIIPAILLKEFTGL